MLVKYGMEIEMLRPEHLSEHGADPSIMREYDDQGRSFDCGYEWPPDGSDSDHLSVWAAWGWRPPCNCSDCLATRYYDAVQGGYIEVSPGRSIDRVSQVFIDAGLLADVEVHDTHCQCNRCLYERDTHLLTAQYDCTVGVEYITRILGDTARDVDDLKTLESVYPEALAAGGWTPNGNDNDGNHVHVGWPDESLAAPSSRSRIVTLINALMGSNLTQWQTIANGGCGRLRSYNSPPTPSALQGPYPDVSSSWATAHGRTMEFRLWNTPVDAKRLLAHPAMSIGLMCWAMTRLEKAAGFATAREIFEWISEREKKERERVAGLILAEWPEPTSALTAAELIAA